MHLAVTAASPALAAAAAALAARYGLPFEAAATAHAFALVLDDDGLALVAAGPDAPGPIRADWTGGASAHRRRFGGGRGQPLARAVGLKHGACPTVVDATAGLGRDAFVLAGLGCEVRLVERSAAIAALLEDGLRRAAADAGIGDWVRARMRLVHADAARWLAALPATEAPDVVYLDPMYPHRRGSALVKKEMRQFRALLGDDPDADALLAPALACARRRVVVKRPRQAEPLAGRAPSFEIASPNTRYDVYVIAALPGA